MDKDAEVRQKKLYEIASMDVIYQTWQQSFEDSKDAFIRFANIQPEEIRNMLYGYAECGRMAQQRLVNLACENMVFPDEEYTPMGIRRE